MERQGWMYHKILFYLCLTLIVFFSIIPQDVNSSLLSGMKLTKSGFFLHVFGYFVLSALACQVFRGNNICAIFGGILIMGNGINEKGYKYPENHVNPVKKTPDENRGCCSPFPSSSEGTPKNHLDSP